MGNYEQPIRYLPPQHDIQKVCEEIQKAWTPTEKKRRQAYRSTRWEVPTVSRNSLDEDTSEDA